MTNFIVYSYFFILGSCIGSFLNVIIYRVPNGIPFIKGRSFCPKCNTTIKMYDLIPILSFFFLGGKCRACKNNVSIQYPIIEAITGVITVGIIYKFNISLSALIVFIISCILICIAVVDIETMIIPDEFIIAIVPFAIAYACFTPNISFFQRIIGFFIISIPMYLLTCFIENAFGGGDIKLIAICGFILGWKYTLIAGFMAIILAGTTASYLLVTKKINNGCHIPFGQYICIGVFFSLLFGREILTWYSGFLI